MLDVAVTGGIVVDPDGASPADVGIIGETVVAVVGAGRLGAAKRTIDARGCYVLPGLVDPHTHPGNFRPLDVDIASETRSAAIGGVTTMLGTVKVTRFRPDSPPTTTAQDAGSYVEAFPMALAAVDRGAHVDVGFSFVVMTLQHAREIPRCASELGVTSFKFFMTFPPATAWGARVGTPLFPDEGTILAGFRACAASGSLAMVHAENAQVIEALGAELAAGRTGLAGWEARFPGSLEASEVRKAAEFARLTGARAYAVHVSSHEGLAAVDAARSAGIPMRAETCPQYLTLDVEKDAGRGPLARFNPPIRHRADADALWAAAADGRIDALGSDHVPNLRAAKVGDGTVQSAVSGSPGVATLLPLLWTWGVEAGRLTPERLVELISTGPARLFGLAPRKGRIRPGADADLVVVDPERRRVVDAAALGSWADFSAWEGQELAGWPKLTMLRGVPIAENGQVIGEPRGRYLSRPLAPHGSGGSGG